MCFMNAYCILQRCVAINCDLCFVLAVYTVYVAIALTHSLSVHMYARLVQEQIERGDTNIQPSTTTRTNVTQHNNTPVI
jgi:hypothetical protein